MHEVEGLLSWVATETSFRSIPKQAVVAALEELAPDTGNGNRVPSQRVYEDVVQCLSCVIGHICPIKTEFEATIATEEKQQEIERVKRQMAMFENGPEWLIAGRLHGIHMTEKAFKTMLTGTTDQATALRQNFSVDALLGDIHNRPLQPLNRKELPKELATCLTSAQRAETFETHEITFRGNNQTFVVADLSVQNGYTGIRPTEKAYGILISKLMDVMKELGPNGQPLVLSANLQKVVRYFDGGYVAEIRMGDKSRLYTGVCVAVMRAAEPSSGPTYRLLILGSHGDSEKAQQHFYDQTGLSRLQRRT